MLVTLEMDLFSAVLVVLPSSPSIIKLMTVMSFFSVSTKGSVGCSIVLKAFFFLSLYFCSLVMMIVRDVRRLGVCPVMDL